MTAKNRRVPVGTHMLTFLNAIMKRHITILVDSGTTGYYKLLKNTIISDSDGFNASFNPMNGNYYMDVAYKEFNEDQVGDHAMTGFGLNWIQ